MPPFVPGKELAGAFYREVVRPILDSDFPGLAHSAGLLHTGSEVLGFDTPQSTDHNWGPRVDLYLSEADHPTYAETIRRRLRERLPHTFRGFPTNFQAVPDEPGTGHLLATESGPVNHRVFVSTVRGLIRDYLGIDSASGPTAADWLTFSEQMLRTLTQGAVYHDGLGELEPLRRALAFYPHDVWLYLMAAAWQRISQEEPFVGRAGDVGDDIGSRVIAARLVRDVMRLCFLQERQYAPYPKWFGTGFARLACAAELTPLFQKCLASETWQSREAWLGEAYSAVARQHNALGLTKPLPTQISPFHSRPYNVIHGEVFADALLAEIHDPAVRRIAATTRIGSVEQFSDSTDLNSQSLMRRKLLPLYDPVEEK